MSEQYKFCNCNARNCQETGARHVSLSGVPDDVNVAFLTFNLATRQFARPDLRESFIEWLRENPSGAPLIIPMRDESEDAGSLKSAAMAWFFSAFEEALKEAIRTYLLSATNDQLNNFEALVAIARDRLASAKPRAKQ